MNVRGTWKRSGVLSTRGGKNGQKARKRVKWTRRERGDWQKADKYKEMAAGQRWLRKKRTRAGGISEERSCKMRSEEGRETTSLNGTGENERIMKAINSILLYCEICSAETTQMRRNIRHKCQIGTDPLALELHKDWQILVLGLMCVHTENHN